MSVVAIQAWKSALAQGAPFEIPDFRKEAPRKKYQGEQWSPYPEDRDKAPNQPPPSVLGVPKVTAKQIAAARKVWRDMGYEGE